MRKVIYKYPIPIKLEPWTLKLPYDSKIVLVDTQDGEPTMWVELEQDQKFSNLRMFQWVGTGHPYPDRYKHVASIQTPPYVWHLMEI